MLIATCSINFEVLTAVSFSPFHQILQSLLPTMTSVSLYQNCKFDLAIIISNLWRQFNLTWLSFFENEGIHEETRGHLKIALIYWCIAKGFLFCFVLFFVFFCFCFSFERLLNFIWVFCDYLMMPINYPPWLDMNCQESITQDCLPSSASKFSRSSWPRNVDLQRSVTHQFTVQLRRFSNQDGDKNFARMSLLVQWAIGFDQTERAQKPSYFQYNMP